MSGPSSEAKFQVKVGNTLRGEGIMIQKFQDSLSLGIPDFFVGGTSLGMWIEMKWVDEWPVGQDTPLGPRLDLTGNQRAWAMRFHGKPCPCMVMIGSEQGWCIVKAPDFEHDLDNRPASMLKLWQEKPNMINIIKAYRGLPPPTRKR